MCVWIRQNKEESTEERVRIKFKIEGEMRKLRRIIRRASLK